MDVAARHGDDPGEHTVSLGIGRIHFRKDKNLNIRGIRTLTKGIAWPVEKKGTRLFSHQGFFG
jgi:hypothetical protein